jgi:tRNA dimethylallyltransferase
MPTKKPKTALLIAGPTASGKSALAMERAAALKGVIINADALQVYQELQILSARPNTTDMSKRPHMLYGHVSGTETYSVGRWLTEAEAAAEAAWSEGQMPIFCGGTGLYFKALLHGLATVPPSPQDVREKWRGFSGNLHDELAKRDAAMAARLHPSDRQRLMRALEVIDGTGKSLLVWHAEAQATSILAGCSVERVFLSVPRDVLYARAETRFDEMLRNGALDEVRVIQHLDPTLPMMRAIGVSELLAHLKGEITMDQAIVDAKTATRNFIKRQLTWWRGQMRNWSLLEP